MEQNPKQQIVETVRQASSVLVTVSHSPSVDELSAALGLTLMLNKLGKHSTALVSGSVPHAMEFLNPQKTFESSVDSLRDFIISLDKDKADKLHYKLEDDVVKIFITPYKQQIKEEDISFSQGDYNVDVVLALGVEKKGDLDKALNAHGRILHNATIITVNANNKQSDIGSINWQDLQATSICEMLVSISEAFQGGLLDEQISTAFLTGIIAATNRFSSTNTTPKIMTMAAQLMASGANQQLISTNLQTSNLQTGGDLQAAETKSAQSPSQPVSSTEFKVEHTTYTKKPGLTQNSGETDYKPVDNAKSTKIEFPLPKDTPTQVPSHTDEVIAGQNIMQLEKELHAHEEQEKKEPLTTPRIKGSKGFGPQDYDPAPMLGGTFNATAAKEQDDRRRSMDNPLNKTVLTHKSQTGGETPSVDLEALRREVEEAAGKLETTNISPPQQTTSMLEPQTGNTQTSTLQPTQGANTFQLPGQAAQPGLTQPENPQFNPAPGVPQSNPPPPPPASPPPSF